MPILVGESVSGDGHVCGECHDEDARTGNANQPLLVGTSFVSPPQPLQPPLCCGLQTPLAVEVLGRHLFDGAGSSADRITMHARYV